MNGSGRCSIGFSVKRGTQNGFATAGHCGRVGTTTNGFNQQAQGTFQGSTFPGRDYAWVATNANWTPRPTVSGYGRGDVTVAGSTASVVGASVCRSGSTTGWHCGTIQQLNTSVTYPEGTISGVTRTSVCAEPGDSGGSYISGNQAQGVYLRRLGQLLVGRYDVLPAAQPAAPGVRADPGHQRYAHRPAHHAADRPAHRPAGRALGGRHRVHRRSHGDVRRSDLPLPPGPHGPARLDPRGRPGTLAADLTAPGRVRRDPAAPDPARHRNSTS